MVPLNFMADAAVVVPTAPGRSQTLVLAQRLHDTVVQRLAGISMLLGAEQPLDAETRTRCHHEILAALAELRCELEDLVDLEDRASVPTVDGELAALAAEHPTASIDCSATQELLGDHVQPLVDAFLVEGLRNARKHATPTRVELELDRGPGTVGLALRNDGVRPDRGRGCGMGLRLLEMEASMLGGLVNSRPSDKEGWWQLRLILPSAA